MSKKPFKIEVQEFLSRIVEVDAINTNDAINKVKKQYKESKIVLNYNDFVEVDFSNINNQSLIDKKNMLIKEVIEYLYTDEEKHFLELDKPNDHIFLKLKKLSDIIN